MCLGLEFAHSHGIVHRDLKPGNVWLTAEGTAKIGDFGLAFPSDRSRLTEEGMMVGTASYMSPEQVMGGEVTPRSDLYSLGAMLYEMVTGRPPFVGDNNVAIIGQHINTPPVAPTWHNPSCPKSLETLILRLLEKDPSARPASASDVLTALESVEAEEKAHTPDTAVAVIPTGTDPVYGHIFVGREAEVHQLRTAFDGAMSGEGALMMVVGEPGIGKTTLCQQLQTYVTLRGGTTLIGHCYEEGSLSLPYLGFVEAIRGYVLDRDTETLRKELGSGASEVARIVSEVRERLEVDPRPPSDPEDDRYRLLNAVSSFLRSASMVQPLLIVLEDLHDADSGTLDMLTHVARNLGGSRLLVVGTYRDVEVDRTQALSPTLAELRRVSSFGRIGLRGLTADEVQRMMTGIAGREMPWSLSEAVFRQTEGNPLFVQELLRDLVERGSLSGDEAQSISEITESIPEGLRDVIGKRLSRLSDECNEVLRIAAVIGREFRLDVLEKVAGVSEELISALEEAQGLGVIEERTGAQFGVAFWFTHAFFRQTLYDETFAPRRIRLHQQVGRALEGVYADRLEDHADELSEHFAQSTEPEDLEKALKYGEMAAERAMSVYASSEAARLLEQALQVQEVLDPENKAKRCDLLIALGEALMPAGDSLHVYEDVAPDAFALAEAIGDDDRASRVCSLAVDAGWRYSAGVAVQEPEFGVWADRFDRLATPGTSHRVLADLAMSMMYLQRDTGEVWRLRKRALDLSRQLGDSHLFVMIASMIFGNSWAPQHERERLDLAREVGGKYVTMQSGTVRDWPNLFGGVNIRFLVNAYLQMGERAKAEELWGEMRERATRTHDVNLIMGTLRAEATVATLDGRLEDALVVGETIRSKGEELGIPDLGQGIRSEAIYWPLILLGRIEEVTSLLRYKWTVERGFRDRPFGDSKEWEIPLDFRAAVAALDGRVEEGLDLFRRSMEEGGQGEEGDETRASYLLGRLNLAVLVGDREAAQGLYGRLGVLSDQSMSHRPGQQVSPPIPRVLGGAAALLGEYQAARMHYDKALELMGRMRFRPELAMTHLWLAELLLEHYPDERAEGQEHLDTAIAELRDMKMQPALERALAVKDQAESGPIRAPAYPDGLTERELEVLRLIAAGKSNREIGDDLFISVRTVERHITNIYRKIDAHGRADATAYALRHDMDDST